MRTIRFAAALAAAVAASACAAQSPGPAIRAPKTVEEFKTAVQAVLSETGVPGAGLALVRMSGVEWAGGVGLADRDRKTPVTADTHFRAGSISKTFIAIGARADVPGRRASISTRRSSELAPGDPHRQRRGSTEFPVRVIHLLQHTAGFDDMHFNEMYNVSDPPDMPLVDVLRINPRSRVVRWQPGTRMSYSNPGYAVAGYLIEKVTGEKYEDRIAEQIFKPAGMPTSSFVLTHGRRGAAGEGLSRSHRARRCRTRRSICGPPATSTPRRSSSADSCTCC